MTSLPLVPVGSQSLAVTPQATSALSVAGASTTSLTLSLIGTTFQEHPGLLIQEAITSLGAAGGTITMPPGVYALDQTILLPPSLTGRLVIRGSGGTTIRLTSAAPRLFDFDRTATTSVGVQALPAGTFNVSSTDGFPASGAIQVGTLSTSSPTTLITYTGKTTTSFTGCSTTTITTQAAGSKVELAHETFQNITIEDLIVDADSLGNRQHVILGTYGRYSDASHEYRMNIDQLAVRRVKAINVLTDSNIGTNHRLGLYLVVGQAAANETTQTTLTNIDIEDVRIEGGNYGFTVGGTGITNVNLNVFVDNVNLKRCWHSLMALQSSSFSSANYFIASRGFGGRCSLEDCYGQYSADVGVEIDAMTASTVERCTIDDAYNANYFHTNFRTPKYAAAQVLRFSKCTSRRFTMSGRGFYFNTSGGDDAAVALGTQVIEDCTIIDQYSASPPDGYAIYRVDATAPAGTFSTKLIVRDTTVVHDSWNNSAGGTFNVRQVFFNPSAGACNTLDIDGLHFKVNGTVTGSPTLNFRCIELQGTKANLDIRNVDCDGAGLTGTGASSLRLVTIGVSATTLQGWARLRGLSWVNNPGSASPFGVVLQGTSTLTVGSQAGILVEGCDFSQQTAGSGVSVVASQNPFVFRRRNGYGAGAPTIHPTTLTGLVTAVGSKISTGWDAIVQFVQGSGTAITAIDYSTDAGTNYINLLTQASAALPAGADINVGPLPTDALIKVTFTGTQPTINLVPVNP